MARYVIQSDRSTVSISASSSVHGLHTEADGLEGWVEIDVRADGSVDLTSPAGHLDFPVEHLHSGNPLEDRELRRRIDARAHPMISGDLTSMTAAGRAGRYLVGGDLTFKGATNRYEDEMELTVVDAGTINLRGESVFDIRDFGMDPPRILMLRVHPDVRVEVDIVAVREDHNDS